MTTLENHTAEYLKLKKKVEKLKKAIDETSLYGDRAGKKHKLVVQFLDAYIKYLRRQSWLEEYNRF
jgi:hypothetical protein